MKILYSRAIRFEHETKHAENKERIHFAYLAGRNHLAGSLFRLQVIGVAAL